MKLYLITNYDKYYIPVLKKGYVKKHSTNAKGFMLYTIEEIVEFVERNDNMVVGKWKNCDSIKIIEIDTIINSDKIDKISVDYFIKDNDNGLRYDRIISYSEVKKLMLLK